MLINRNSTFKFIYSQFSHCIDYHRKRLSTIAVFLHFKTVVLDECSTCFIIRQADTLYSIFKQRFDLQFTNFQSQYPILITSCNVTRGN